MQCFTLYYILGFFSINDYAGAVTGVVAGVRYTGGAVIAGSPSMT
jgi:hypothetical protein